MSDGIGKGTVDGLPFARVLGTGEQVGKGTLYAYVVYVEEGTRVRRRAFARKLEAILADKRSWALAGGKVAFQRVESGGNTQVILALPKTVDKLCYPLSTEGEVSCCQGTKVVVNVERWRNAVPHWLGSVETYRQMLVNHEFGHRIGKGHAWCPGTGKLAPVMQQQTYGLQNCKENSWPLASEL